MQEKDFATKRNALFACLDDASKEIKGTILDQGESPRYNFKRNRADMETSLERQTLSYMRGRESMFKKPEMPITRCLKARKTPDYQINPHKWKKYSLSDVDISDHTNTAAAFSFLKEMDEQRNDAAADDVEEAASSSSTKKIEFKKSSKIARNLRALAENDAPDVEVDKPKLKGSKLVMPEYVVGQRQKKLGKRKQASSSSKSAEKMRAAGSLRLSHLQDEDDNADDSDQDDFTAER